MYGDFWRAAGGSCGNIYYLGAMNEMLRQVVALGDLLMPRECPVCRQTLRVYERYICLHCEADLPLTVENVRKFPRLHPRCGTAFLLIVMIVSIFVFAFLGWPDLWLRILSRILLLPVVAGIAYEIIRFAGRSKNPLVHAAILPGLWLQYLTSREPDDSMIEVAIASLEAVQK